VVSTFLLLQYLNTTEYKPWTLRTPQCTDDRWHTVSKWINTERITHKAICWVSLLNRNLVEDHCVGYQQHLSVSLGTLALYNTTAMRCTTKLYAELRYISSKNDWTVMKPSRFKTVINSMLHNTMLKPRRRRMAASLELRKKVLPQSLRIWTIHKYIIVLYTGCRIWR